MADEENEQSPFSRPSFIIAAVVVAALVVAGVIVGVNVATKDDGGDAQPAPSTTTTTSAAPSAEPTADAGGASVCGLTGDKLSGTITTAPQATWEYQDVYSYPTSPSAGPGETAQEGYRFCYQHSPEGALFAAANATTMAFIPELRLGWLEYALTDGPYRDELLTSARSDTSEGVRASIEGFRMLAYDGEKARVDIAFEGTASGKVVTGSVVFELVWSGGDWKLDANLSEPTRIAQLPDTAGYIPWSEK
jgi:hypothetical protein